MITQDGLIKIKKDMYIAVKLCDNDNMNKESKSIEITVNLFLFQYHGMSINLVGLNFFQRLTTILFFLFCII